MECRLCGFKGDLMVSVFKAVDSSGTLAKKILQYLSIEISETDDSLPTKICEACRKKVEDFHTYKEACEETQRKLLEKRKTTPSVSLIVNTAEGSKTVPLDSNAIGILSAHYNLCIPQSVKDGDRKEKSPLKKLLNTATKTPTSDLRKNCFVNETIYISDESDEEVTSLKIEETKEKQTHVSERCGVEVSVRLVPDISIQVGNITRSRSVSPRRKNTGNLVLFCKICEKHCSTREEMAHHFLVIHDVTYDTLVMKNMHREINLLTYEVDGVAFESMKCEECVRYYPNIRAYKIHYFKYHDMPNKR